jgi:hypothetical protein
MEVKAVGSLVAVRAHVVEIRVGVTKATPPQLEIMSHVFVSPSRCCTSRASPD